MGADWIILTSTHSTPMFVRSAAVLFVEGFDYAADHKLCPGLRGSRLTLAGGQWSETVYAQEDAGTVLAAIVSAEGRQP